jgi:hypothetical protein
VTRSEGKEPQQQEEATVLDWIKSVILRRPLEIPEVEPAERPSRATKAHGAAVSAGRIEHISYRITAAHLRLPVAIVLALMAQFGIEHRMGGSAWTSIAIYILAGCLAVWGIWKGDFRLPSTTVDEERVSSNSLRIPYLISAAVFSILTFLSAGDNRFTAAVLLFWGAALVSLVLCFWEGSPDFQGWRVRVSDWLHEPHIRISLGLYGLALAFTFALAIYFRFSNLSRVPLEMWSDHAEKLLDVMDILNGQPSIYFPRNSGREAIQFYMAAATAKFLGFGISFMTLKFGTALAGVLALPFVYLFAREIGGRLTGLGALFLSGIAYWPNVISRAGLRFPLYPLFAAPALYFLVRGLRRKRRNDLLLCGLFTGFGLQGYSPTRILPFVVAAGVAIFLLHRQAKGIRWRTITWFAILVAAVWLAFLPLMRVALDMPEQFFYRQMTRMGTTERAFPGAPLMILLSNTWRSLTMFAWDNGGTWVVAIPGRPALDWVTGALFHIGLVLLIVRYVRKRNWEDLFTLTSIPLLMLPSILSLAFPNENPALHRSSGAIVPVFTIAALPLAALPDWLRSTWNSRRAMFASAVGVLLLLTISARTNYRLVMDDYAQQVDEALWNTDDIGRVIRGFAESVGSYDTAHVIPYPYWVDTRLVGINAGVPEKDYAIRPEDIEGLVDEDRAQLFIYNQDDDENAALLRQLFPSGTLTEWISKIPSHSFFIYEVPARVDYVPGPSPVPE